MGNSTLRIYLVERPDAASYGQVEAFVAAAHSEAEARAIDPGNDDYSWTPKPEAVKVTEIGVAVAGLKPGVVLSSVIEL